jgi:hypothetical protein
LLPVAGPTGEVCTAAMASLFSREMNSRRLRIGALSIFCCCAGSDFSAILAATVSVATSSDAFVASGSSGQLSSLNCGAAGALSVAGSASSKGQFQSVLLFDFSAAKTTLDAQFGAGQWSPGAVSLQLTAVSPNHPIFNPTHAGQIVVLQMANATWTEGTGTPASPSVTGINFNSLQGLYSSPGDESLGVFAFNGTAPGKLTWDLNLNAGLLNAIETGAQVGLRLNAQDDAVSLVMNSRNYSIPASRPALSIVVVPEPGVLSLVGTALVSFRYWRQRGRGEYLN